MYRVELKAHPSPIWDGDRVFEVPNVPCGVERLKAKTIPSAGVPFLMYRVELKALYIGLSFANPRRQFLMYRVELKAT